MPSSACPSCEGHGVTSCEACSGTGFRTKVDPETDDTIEHECYECRGKGAIDCGRCGGTGALDATGLLGFEDEEDFNDNML